GFSLRPADVMEGHMFQYHFADGEKGHRQDHPQDPAHFTAHQEREDDEERMHVKGAPDDVGGDDVFFQHLNHQVDDDDVKHHVVGDAQGQQYGGNGSAKGAQIGNDVEQGHQGGQEKRIGKADHQITDVGQNAHRQ